MSMTPVGVTSRWIAASRALESESDSPLFVDPLARDLAGDPGFAMMDTMKAANRAVTVKGPEPYLSIRTRFFDDTIVNAARDLRLTQVVLLAAGMDARAFRLEWPEGVVLFEIDRDDVLSQKEAVIARAGATARCDRRVVRADVAGPWIAALTEAGFDRSAPAAFLVEGLLFYLPEPVATQVIQDLSSVACEGSWIGMDAVNPELLASPYFAAYLARLRELGCPWQFGIAEPEAFMAAHGWQATAIGPGENGANYGRWPYPAIPRSVPGMPRTFFVCGRKTSARVAATAPVHEPVVSPIRYELVRGEQVLGSFACPPGDAAFPAVLALGGSDGGLPEYFIDLLVPDGFACLALGYFGMEGLAPALVDIPLERIEHGLRWLARHPRARTHAGRVGIIAASRGAELALLAASTWPDLVGPVVAYTPSHVVWPGIDYTGARDTPASWTHGGRPFTTMRYVPGIAPTVSQKGLALASIVDRALDDEAVAGAASIPIERATGPLLLISGGDDHVWPAARMCNAAVDRMRRRGREHLIEHLHYPDAGHGLFPYRAASGTAAAAPMPLDLGGAADAWRTAHADAWPRVVKTLRG